MKNFIFFIVLFIFSFSAVADENFAFPFTTNHQIKYAKTILSTKFLDVDLDKDIDILVITTEEGGPGFGHFVLLSNKNGEFKTYSINEEIPYPRFITAGDIDGDGDIDVAVNTSGAGIMWFENIDGKGKIWDKYVITEKSCHGHIEFADIDGDGDLDLVLAKYSELIGWHENKDGKGQKWGSFDNIGKEYDGYRSLLLVDYDGDNDIDIVTGNEKKFLWYENKDGAWESHNIRNHSVETLEAVDIDKDGDLDILVGSDQHVSILMNYGKGRFAGEEIKKSEPGLLAMYRARSGDIDNDGDIDIVVIGGRGGLVWLEQLGDDEWKEHTIKDANYVETELHVADLDGDGDGDINIVKYYDSWYVKWWENKTRAKK